MNIKENKKNISLISNSLTHCTPHTRDQAHAYRSAYTRDTPCNESMSLGSEGVLRITTGPPRRVLHSTPPGWVVNEP